MFFNQISQLRRKRSSPWRESPSAQVCDQDKEKNRKTAKFGKTFYMDTHVVIMAGGVGSRLWPISTPSMPKQFIDVLGVGKSLIQLTMERFMPVCEPENFWVVTSENYVETVRRQLPGIPEDQILAEPVGRNTAPCIAYACRKIAVRHPSAAVVVTPADALVLKTDKFAETIRTALETVDGTDKIVTVGIKPTRPETGYGYICSAEVAEDKVVKVEAFKEKPDLETARRYMEAGNYFWNAGIFVWSVATINDQLRRHAPQIADIMDRIAPSLYTAEETAALHELFPRCEKISIDYAVMEKSSEIHVIASDLGWSDLGTWGSVKEHIPADADGNSAVGTDVRLFGCNGCLVHAEKARTVIAEGLDGYIIAESDGNILVCRLSEEQHIREYSQGK